MDIPFVTPRLRLLNPEHIQQIHQYALAVLSNPGVRVDSPQTRRLFAARLGSAAVQDDRVCIPSDVVEWALQTAPSVIDIFNRTGAPAFQLGADRARFGIGVTTLFSFVTLPVELDASRRALVWLEGSGLAASMEHEKAKNALFWAAMTYVAAALGSLAQLLYFLSMALGRRD